MYLAGKALLVLACTGFHIIIFAQAAKDTIVVAGSAYQKSSLYQKFFGKNHRNEWLAKVKVPVINLDSVYGGLTAYAAGGGNETRSLRLKNSLGKEYALRSINKSREEVIPEEFKNTFAENIIKDGISMSHPYGAFAVSEMMEAAGLHHTLPLLVWIPSQPALDTFNERFGNDLYLLEQRPDGDWSEAPNLGNYAHIFDTDEVRDQLLTDHQYQLDQKTFVKARLFDMLINDWDRHEDNWKWGLKDSAGYKLFVPIAKDRDQAFYHHDGLLIDKMLPAAGLGYMQKFSTNTSNVNMLNWEMRNIDRYFTNKLSLNDWLDIARNLESHLTDSIIKSSIQQLPLEVYAINGEQVIQTLIVRRSQLTTWAKDYYLFLAEEVEVTGTNKRDLFEVNANNDNIEVNVYHIDSTGSKQDAYWKRSFNSIETKEIRLFGINGEDVYRISGNFNAITLRIIGGSAKDSVIQDGNGKLFIYDDHNNNFSSENAKLRLSTDSSVHEWKYYNYQYDKKGFTPVAGQNDEDRLFVGLKYGFTNYAWRKEPYATKQSIALRYSIDQKAFSVVYNSIYPKLIANWVLLLNGTYDAIRWTNFYGLGNESKYTTTDLEYHRVRSEEWLADIGIRKQWGKSTVDVGGWFRQIRIINDTARFVGKVIAPFFNNVLQKNMYRGVQLSYSYLQLDDSIVPIKGFTFVARAGLAYNSNADHSIQRYNARFNWYIPLISKFSLKIRGGAETVPGSSLLLNPQLPEYTVIGGSGTLRGYRGERFWGTSSFFNQNELRFITNFHNHWLNAKIGLLAFFDQGRVYIKNETSNTLHRSFGGGFMIAPFYKGSVTMTYGISNESKLIQMRFNKLF
jgi:hypothetical protein